MDPITLMFIGAGTQILGQYGANIQQALAEARNAQFYREQQEFNIAALQKDLATVQREYGYRIGQVQTVTAGSGLDVGAGSSLTNVATLLADQTGELDFVRRKGELEIKIAGLRAGAAQEKADTLASPGYNLLQAGTSVFSYLTAAKAGKPSPTGATGLLGANTNFGSY